jgi:two-component system, chemotaxis family, protein-glutamate methylesterase/glutaminase
MPKQDIMVIGTSAGGVEALQVVAAGLPANLPASVFVVLHIGTGINGQSYLPEILTKAGPLPAVRPRDGEAIQHGKVYVAPPDHHLLVMPGHVRLSHGPEENRTRPAINPLFRSAAAAYGERVTGVILTGSLDDGVAGLADIKRQGGVAVAEDPTTALFSSMPYNATLKVEMDFVVPLPEIAEVVSTLAVTERSSMKNEEPMEKILSHLTCPECRGPLSKERQGKIVEYRCRVGHVFSPLAMAQEHRDTVERSLWMSVLALEEAAEIAEALVPELGPDALEDARTKRKQSADLKAMLNSSQREP